MMPGGFLSGDDPEHEHGHEETSGPDFLSGDDLKERWLEGDFERREMYSGIMKEWLEGRRSITQKMMGLFLAISERDVREARGTGLEPLRAAKKLRKEVRERIEEELGENAISILGLNSITLPTDSEEQQMIHLDLVENESRKRFLDTLSELEEYTPDQIEAEDIVWAEYSAEELAEMIERIKLILEHHHQQMKIAIDMGEETDDDILTELALFQLYKEKLQALIRVKLKLEHEMERAMKGTDKDEEILDDDENSIE